MEMLTQKQKMLVGIGIAVVIVIVVIYYINSTRAVYNSDDLSLETEENEIEEPIEEKEEKIVVHITGAVKTQGIVKANESARINDIIELAGGITENADISKVNLAYPVQDGQKIYIPIKGEGEETGDDGEVVKEGAGENVIEENEEKNSVIVNINTANEITLQELPGIRKLNSAKDYNIQN